MATLTGQTIASSYEQLLHVDRDGGGNGTTLVDVKDGDNGTTFALKLAQFHAEIRGTTGTGATGAGKLNLSTSELTVVDNDVLGKIDFLAPLESSGTDAILAGASIWGEAEDTFAADNNSTALVFATNTSATATERMRISSAGNVTMSGSLTVNGDLADIAGSHPTLKLTDSDDSNYAAIGYSDGALSLQTNGGDEGGAADTITFFNHGSTERMKIKSNGNVQIGAHASGTPLASNLFLVGTGATTEGIVIGRAGDSQNALDQYAQVNMYGGTTNLISRGGTSSEGTIALVTTSNGSTYNTRLFVNSNGNIGIGTSSVEANWLSTRTALQLGGTGAIFGATTAGADGDLSIGQNVYFHSGGSFKRIEADEASLYQQTAGTHTFSATASSTADSNITFTDVAKFDINSRISLSNNDSGTSNTIFGKLAGAALDNAGASNNVIIGEEAGNDLNGAAADNNVIIGYQAFDRATTTNEFNVAIGTQSMHGNWTSADVDNCVAVGGLTLGGTLTTAASGSVAIGMSALGALTSGSGNTAVGFQSGNILTTGGTNTIIGYDADVDANDRAGCIVIGSSLSLNTASDNVVEIGNNTNSMTYDLDGGDITVTSDVRTKKNIKDTKLGLEFINKLRPITYQTKSPFQYPKEFGIENPSKKSSGKTWDGLIAQEVKEVMDEMNIEFSGWEEGINTKQRLAYGKFVMPLIKAVQELSTKVTELENK